mmetsp:Transcript_7770/g.9627  ORF Transcript_7770/g.9627 Transcript_7770/m.9627 type:complete len:125 (-) Transcript_7770:39-413(-)
MPFPTYRRMGDHTESVRVYFDPSVISYDELLAFFWDSHSPLGCTSTQYRSAIWYHSEEQLQLALNSKTQYEKEKNCKVTTHIGKRKKFYLAEEYHQKYYQKREKRFANKRTSSSSFDISDCTLS